MKDYCIPLDKIRDQDVEEVGSSPLSSINERFEPSSLGAPVFKANPEFSLLASYEGDNIYSLKGTVQSVYSQPCVRCGEELDHNVVSEIDLLLSPLDQEGSEILQIDGDALNVKEIVEDSLILEIDRFEASHKECPGFKQPEQEEGRQSLGSALKKAGLS